MKKSITKTIVVMIPNIVCGLFSNIIWEFITKIFNTSIAFEYMPDKYIFFAVFSIFALTAMISIITNYAPPFTRGKNLFYNLRKTYFISCIIIIFTCIVAIVGYPFFKYPDFAGTKLETFLPLFCLMFITLLINIPLLYFCAKYRGAFYFKRINKNKTVN